MPARAARRAGLLALRVLPKSVVSRMAGRVAEWRLPSSLRAPVLRGFGMAVGVDFSEVRDPLSRFTSLQAFFTRALRAGARPIDPAPDALLAPCDGAWGEAGEIRDGVLLQVKGRPYSLAELLGDASLSECFEGGRFATFYLSPRDYHRFHGCCDVRVRELRYLPGELWPVNRLGVEGVEALFARNERIALLAQRSPAGAQGGSKGFELALVAVGATLVGGIRLVFDDLCSRSSEARPLCRRYPDSGVALARGAEWGRFEFGSTLVLLTAPGVAELEPKAAGSRVRFGTRIGHLLAAGSQPGAS